MLTFQRRSRVQNLGKRKGQTVHYAQQVNQGRLGLSQVEERIVRETSLSKADVRSAIAALAAIVNDAILSGMSVDLGDLGSFKVTASGRYMDTAEDVTARSIKSPRLRYFPKQEMKTKASLVHLSILSERGELTTPEDTGSPAGTPPGTGASPSPGGSDQGGSSEGEGGGRF